MSWAHTVRDWNRSGKKVIVDANDVYALPLRGTEEYKVVRELYDAKRDKMKKKEVKFEEGLKEKREAMKPAAVKVQKFIDDIYEDFTEPTSEEKVVERREKALEGLKKVASETAERNKQRKREAAERAMMAGEEVQTRNVMNEKIIKKEAKRPFTPKEGANLIDDKYVEGYEFKDRKDMGIAVRALRAALPEMTASVDSLAKFFMKRGFKGREYEIAFRKGAARPGKTFVQDALNNKV
jgi:hypothetical protein